MTPPRSEDPAAGRRAEGREVLLLVPEFPPRSSGGGGLVYLRLAEEYARLGLRVRVVALDVTRSGLWARPEREEREGYEIVYLPVVGRWISRGTSFTGALPPSIPGLVHLVREMRTGPWDAAHLHGVPMLVEDLGATLARLRGRPFVLTVHGVVQSPERFGRPLAWAYRAWLSWERWTYRGAAAVTAVSRATLEECRALGLVGRKMAVVPVTPHPRPQLSAGSAEEEWLASVGLVPGQYLACVGNFVARKGQDLLVEALGILARDPGAAPELLVAFAGSDFGTGFREALARRARELGVAGRVRFLGRISDPEKLTLYRHCLGAVVPTRYEASPMVAFEALELGLPLVASDIPCITELLSDRQNALLFRAGDAADLARALVLLVREPGLAGRLTEGARRLVEEFPTWRQIAQSYLALLFPGAVRPGPNGSEPPGPAAV